MIWVAVAAVVVANILILGICKAAADADRREGRS